jgi:hypothetical protein
MSNRDPYSDYGSYGLCGAARCSGLALWLQTLHQL